MYRPLSSSALAGIFCAAAAGSFITGCSPRQNTLLGTMPVNMAIVRVKDVKPTSGVVTLRGVMVEKCPVAACWFRLQDSSGIVKVDVKAANFTVSDVPLNSTVTVSGKPVREGDQISLAGTGLRY